MFIRSTFAAGGLLVSLLCPIHLAAEASSNELYDNGGISTQIVDYGDLDLREVEGQKQLHRRVTNAAAKLCKANIRSTIPLHDFIEQKHCMSVTIRGAQLQIAAAISRAKNNDALIKTSRESSLS